MPNVSHIVPFKDEDELVAFVRMMNGKRQHDIELGKTRGFPRFVMDVLRRILDKTEYKRPLHPIELKQSIVDDYMDGMSTKDMCSKYGMTVGAVYNVLDTMGVERNRKNMWTKIQCMRLLDLRDNKHKSWREIGMIMGKSQDAVHLKHQSLKNERPRQKNRKNNETENQK